MAVTVLNPIEEGEESKNGLPPTPFEIGDVVKHVNGQRGRVLGSVYFDPENRDYGKKVKVALQGSRFDWAIDDLVEPDPKIGKTVKHKNGQVALVVGVSQVGMVTVRDVRQEEVWNVADIEANNDEVTILQQAAQIVELETQITALKAKPKAKVGVKTLVQELSCVSGYNTAAADRDLNDALLDGWHVLDISLVTETVGDSDCISTNLIRVVTLKKQDDETDLADDHEGALIEAAANLIKATESETESESPAAEVKPFVVTIEHPEPQPVAHQPVMVTVYPDVVDIPNTISFEEALRNPRLTVEEIIEIGNQQAFEKGRAVFEGLQNASSANGGVPRPYGEEPRFGGMRIAQATVK